jgi:hypothetical protein
VAAQLAFREAYNRLPYLGKAGGQTTVSGGRHGGRRAASQVVATAGAPGTGVPALLCRAGRVAQRRQRIFRQPPQTHKGVCRAPGNP